MWLARFDMEKRFSPCPLGATTFRVSDPRRADSPLRPWLDAASWAAKGFRSRLDAKGLAALLGASVCAVASGAAQAQSLPDKVAAPPAAVVAPGVDASSDDAKFKYFDSLADKGWIYSVPSTSDSLIADTGGVRSALAAYGIGFLGLGSYSFFDDTLHNSVGTQYYLGQKPTYGSSTSLTASLNLNQYGIPNAQITASGDLLTTTWKPFGPPAFSLQRLDYFQSFFNDRIEVKAGYVTNHYEFFGTYVGGSVISGTLGPSANVLYQAGLSRTPLTAPTVNVRFNGPNNLYIKSAIQRSIDPAGGQAEHDANPTGLQFRTPGTRALFINEIGYKRPASTEDRSIWVRGGALVNNSPYPVFGTLRTSSNNAYAILGDVQFIKTDRDVPARGIYAGASFLKGDPNVDGTDQYYEARVYGIGVIPRRPRDFVSLVFTHSKFSQLNQLLYETEGAPSASTINNLTVSYSAHIARGIFLNTGITYGDHASITPVTRPTLVFSGALSVIY